MAREPCRTGGGTDGSRVGGGTIGVRVGSATTGSRTAADCGNGSLDGAGTDSGTNKRVRALRRITRHNVAIILVAVAAATSSLDLSAQEAADGAQLLTQSGCAICHGADGQGTAAGPSLAAGTLSLDEFVAAVRQATRTMPAYAAEVLPDEDLTRMFAFLEVQTAEPAAGRADVGAELYSAYGCYSCHANEAQGGQHGPRLGPDPITFARFSWYTRHPTRTMPPYSAVVLSDQDMADIYAFVEAQPQPPPLESIPLLAP